VLANGDYITAGWSSGNVGAITRTSSLPSIIWRFDILSTYGFRFSGVEENDDGTIMAVTGRLYDIGLVLNSLRNGGSSYFDICYYGKFSADGNLLYFRSTKDKRWKLIINRSN
jgi:hypothetical protein